MDNRENNEINNEYNSENTLEHVLNKPENCNCIACLMFGSTLCTLIYCIETGMDYLGRYLEDDQPEEVVDKTN